MPSCQDMPHNFRNTSELTLRLSYTYTGFPLKFWSRRP